MSPLPRPLLAVCILSLAGCASSEKIDARLAEVDQRIASLEIAQARLAEQQSSLSKLPVDGKVLAERMDSVQAQAASAKSLAEQASQSAQAARIASEQAAQAVQGVHIAAEQAATASGLATKTVAEQSAKIVASQAAQQTEMTRMAASVDSQAKASAEALETSRDAVKIARDIRSIAGKVVEELSMGEDMVPYGFDVADLTPAGRAALDQLIEKVKVLMPHVFIEISGHSDDMATGDFNLRIAEGRAESVRRYLHQVGGLPLQRMAVISYGARLPVAGNDSKVSRLKNRRVTVTVLK